MADAISNNQFHHPPPTVHQPLTQTISVIGPQYLAPYPVDLTITEKTFSLTDGDYAVTDVNGNIVFKVKGKLLSLRDKRSLVDASGNTLVTMRQKVMTAHHRWEAFRGDSTDAKDLLFSVKKSSFFQIKTELDVFFSTNTSEDVCDLKIKGSYFERACTIFQGNSDVIVAQMYRQYTGKNILLGKDAFGVTIYPNVDYAFIVSLVVILDEINKDRDGRD
ncbi:hypothetical protein MRB53_003854 [Persea americana]|uniref:Uncharacterized protein n=1 Tax=Persea americana TaxID=3435 RepID=A0ACC2MYJ6_PERAE|nr:hypothetical protein MRB53_003854 [Persea americana]